MNDVQKMSVAELCGEIREAPFYDDHADITRQQLAKAYDRLLEVSLELAEWIEGTDLALAERMPDDEEKGGES